MKCLRAALITAEVTPYHQLCNSEAAPPNVPKETILKKFKQHPQRSPQ